MERAKHSQDDGPAHISLCSCIQHTHKDIQTHTEQNNHWQIADTEDWNHHINALHLCYIEFDTHHYTTDNIRCIIPSTTLTNSQNLWITTKVFSLNQRSGFAVPLTKWPFNLITSPLTNRELMKSIATMAHGSLDNYCKRQLVKRQLQMHTRSVATDRAWAWALRRQGVFFILHFWAMSLLSLSQCCGCYIECPCDKISLPACLTDFDYFCVVLVFGLLFYCSYVKLNWIPDLC